MGLEFDSYDIEDEKVGGVEEEKKENEEEENKEDKGTVK